MPILDLLLGTRRLRRRIDAQALLLQTDIEQARLRKAQLRQHFVARATSPLGLGIAAATGFVLARASGPLRRPLHAGATALATLGWRLLFPLATGWLTDSALALLRGKADAPPPAD